MLPSGGPRERGRVMAWGRLDDALLDHPKVEPLSDRAFRAFIGSICLCNRYLTDGALTKRQVDKIATAKARQELIGAALWHEGDEGGVLVHDFLDYNRDAHTQKKERRRNADRQKQWREQQRLLREQQSNDGSNSVTDGVTDSVTNGVSNAAPSRPVPYRPEKQDLGFSPKAESDSPVELITSPEGGDFDIPF
jgi:hypothetical protein